MKKLGVTIQYITKIISLLVQFILLPDLESIQIQLTINLLILSEMPVNLKSRNHIFIYVPVLAFE